MRVELENLRTKFVGKKFLHYGEISSTQIEMWKLYNEDKLTNGEVISADIQLAGVGTHGRKWITDQPDNLAFSVFVKTDCDIKRFDEITVDIALAIVRIFRRYYGINLSIKEPNDIVFNGKKIGGILTETKVSGERVKALVVGIGLNTSQVEFDDEIKDIATSIKKEFGVFVDRNEFISLFCNEYEKILFERVRI